MMRGSSGRRKIGSHRSIGFSDPAGSVLPPQEGGGFFYEPRWTSVQIDTGDDGTGSTLQLGNQQLHRVGDG